MLSDSPPVRIVMIGLSLPKRSAGSTHLMAHVGRPLPLGAPPPNPSWSWQEGPRWRTGHMPIR